MIQARPHATASQVSRWNNYLQQSITGAKVEEFLNVTMDVEEPLDRLSIGRTLVSQ